MKSKALASIAITATALVATVALTGCGATSASSSSASTNKLQTIKAGQLKVAFRSDDKPISFIENGKPTGFDIELMRAIAKDMGQKVSFVSVDFASMVPNVRNHVYDTAAFGVLVTDDRAKVANFTTAIGYGQAQLLSLKTAPLKTVDEANGKQVAITTGSALIPLLKKEEPDVTVREFPNIASSVNALEAGQVAGLFTGENTTASLLAAHPDFAASQKIISGTNAMPVAKDRSKLKAAFDKSITKIMKNGTYTRLFDKWNTKGITIPDQMLKDYPGLKQRPGASE